MRIGRPVVVMAKVPTPGRVKTRLIPLLGAEGAAGLCRAMTADVLRHLGSIDLCVAVDGDLDDPWVQTLRHRYEAQVAGDLGARLRHALRAGGIAVGTDAPTLLAHVVRQADLLLEEYDVVFVPARDGGYVLVGVRPSALGVFDDIPWSTDHTLAASVIRADALGLSATCLPPLFDVDTPDDLAYLRRELRRVNSRFVSHTRAFLQDLPDAPPHR